MNKMKHRSALALVAALMSAGVASSWAQAQTPTQSPSTTSAQNATKLNRTDAAFLKQAAQNGNAEVESSRLAVIKAVSPQVKTFAQQMIDDHTKANQELVALASSKGVEVSNEPSTMQKGKLKLLSARDGAGFDRSYASTMGVDAHQDTVKLFQKASENATDADVKAFATKTLPTLQHHLQMAKELAATTNAEGNSKASGDRKQ